jgi:hypothetical protein
LPSNRRRRGSEPREKTDHAIFAMDVAAIDWADTVVPASTVPIRTQRQLPGKWGYAYAKGTPIQAA